MGSGGSDAEAFERAVRVLREELARAGRDAAAFPISKRIYFVIDADVERARRRLGEASRTIVWRDGDECAAYLERLVRAGATHLVLNPGYDYEEQLEAVLPHVRALSAGA